MIVELRGVEFANKGAELMLHSIIKEVKANYPDTIFVMEKTSSSPRNKHLEYGIYTRTDFRKFRVEFRHLFKLIPASARHRLKYIDVDEIDVVFDASGFAFGDKWGAEKAAKRLANYIVNWKKKGKKVILLPQAFGPFTDADLRSKINIIIENADLIFARDELSFQYLKELSPGSQNIKLKPDFTNLIKGIVPGYFDKEKHQVGIITNSKMLETASKENGNAYIMLLERIIKTIQAAKYKPYFIIHDEGIGDIKIAEKINMETGTNLPIIKESNPLYVKGLIGQSYAVVTSRYHGLVSCLSQQIPCLSTSWSHKYEMLLQEYDYSEALLNVNITDDILLEKIKSVLDKNSRIKIINKLEKGSRTQQKLSKEMWEEVFVKKSLPMKSIYAPPSPVKELY